MTAVAEIGDVRDVVPAAGTLLAESGAEVWADQSGVITTVLVEEGQEVEAGQVLARLEGLAVVPNHEEAMANYAASQASVAEARTGLDSARADYARRETLVEQEFVSAAGLEAAAFQVRQAEAALARAEAQLRASSARIRRGQADARGYEIRAPVGGTVTLARARRGQRVGLEDEHPLFQITDGIDTLSLEIMIAEPDLSRVSMDSRVVFTVDAYPAIRYDAELLSLGQAPIREGRFVSYRAIARVTNTGQMLLPGMTASVELIRADSREVLRIPARAVFFQPRGYIPPMTPEERAAYMRRYNGDMGMVAAAASGRDFRRLWDEGKRAVFVLKGDEPVRHEVTIGGETDEYIEVLDGLETGDVVIVSRRQSDVTAQPS